MGNTIEVNGKKWIEVGRHSKYYIESNDNMYLDGKYYIPKPKEITARDIYVKSKYHISYPTEKLEAIAIILAVADYLNEGKGCYNNTWREFYINERVYIESTVIYRSKFGFISFHPDVIDKAREILGEEIIKTALS